VFTQGSASGAAAASVVTAAGTAAAGVAAAAAGDAARPLSPPLLLPLVTAAAAAVGDAAADVPFDCCALAALLLALLLLVLGVIAVLSQLSSPFCDPALALCVWQTHSSVDAIQCTSLVEPCNASLLRTSVRVARYDHSALLILPASDIGGRLCTTARTTVQQDCCTEPLLYRTLVTSCSMQCHA
jgi:hypothetical protein